MFEQRASKLTLKIKLLTICYPKVKHGKTVVPFTEYHKPNDSVCSLSHYMKIMPNHYRTQRNKIICESPPFKITSQLSKTPYDTMKMIT